jgi:membrane protease subunit HflC
MLRLGLPESITQKVFERMQAERNRLVQKYKGEGDRQSITIRAKADGERDTILANAESTATRIKGEADAEASKYYSVYEQAPELASFYLGLNALEPIFKEGASLILDPRTPPFDLLINRIPEGPIKPPSLPLSGQGTNGIGSIAESNGQRR